MELTEEEVKTLIACVEEYRYMAQSNYSSDIDNDEKALLLKAQQFIVSKNELLHLVSCFGYNKGIHCIIDKESGKCDLCNKRKEDCN
tara:strand:+ start:525 stop:785 length:261 start_codon:yes stop_codon:yes gene_type:complete